MRVFEATFRAGGAEYRVEASIADDPVGDSTALEFIGEFRASPEEPW